MREQPFWHSENQAAYPVLRGRRSADAVVIGGGLSGMHIAYWLCKAGLRVILLEAETLGSGASGRAAGIVTQTRGLLFSQMERIFGPQVCQAYAQTQNAALQSLRELASEQDMESDWRDMDVSIVMGDPRGKEAMERELETMKRAGFTAALTQATQCPLPAAYAIQISNQATIQPYAHLLSLARKAAQRGLTIFEHSRAIALETNMAYTQRGSVMAPYLIVATGYPVINTPGWYFTRLFQKQSHLLPMEVAPAFDGVYLDAGERFSLRRHRDGALFHQIDGRVGTNLREHPLQRFSVEYARNFEEGAPTAAYGGIDTYSADGLPYIGSYSRKTPNVFVATGYGHSGIVHSVLAAQLISAKILGLPNHGYPIYSGQRSGPTVTRANLKTTLQMSGRYVQGAFRFHAPRCSHMGCKLVYHPRTKSWECPCHGSRFDDIGRVLNAPAVHDATIRHKRKG